MLVKKSKAITLRKKPNAQTAVTKNQPSCLTTVIDGIT